MKTRKILGKVLHTYTSSKIGRIEENEISVDENGVINDKYYKKNPNRSILISSISSYDLVKKNNINIEYGSLKENIILSFDIYELNAGDKIQIESVVLEILENCTICEQLKTIGDVVPKLLEKDRGIFVKAVQSGIIKNNSLVYRLL